MPPPAPCVTLPDRVLLLMVSGPEFHMPPPSEPAPLPDRMLLFMVSVPEFLMPPPSAPLLLPDRMLLLMVSVPEFPIPPAKKSLPLEMVRSEIVTMAPLETRRTSDTLFPLIVSLSAPGPLIVTSPLMYYSPVVSVIVCDVP